MAVKFANNAYSTLAASITSSATSVTLTTGEGARFPTLTGADYFYATLIDSLNNLEIVKVTARSTDVLTIVRGSESSTARAYAAGDRLEQRITAAGLAENSDLVNDTTPQLGGALASNGNDINVADNDSIMFGAGNDLEIMHDGAHSNITDSGTGDLRIRADNLKLSRSSDAEKYIYCTTDAGVQIYHNGSEKLTTTATGATVTGTCAATAFTGDGSALTGVSETRATASVQTTTNRTISYSTAWTTHQTQTVTLGGVGDVRMSFVAASGFEQGNVQAEFRFKCGSDLSPTMSLWNQFSANKGHGSHGGVWEFTSIAAGSTVCELQVRDVGTGSSYIIMNYWDTEADTFMVNYPS
jgi:hypothetical protein